MILQIIVTVVNLAVTHGKAVRGTKSMFLVGKILPLLVYIELLISTRP